MCLTTGAQHTLDVIATLSAWHYKQLVCWQCIFTQHLPACVYCFGGYCFREQLNLHAKTANQDQLQLQATTQQTKGEDCRRAICMSAVVCKRYITKTCNLCEMCPSCCTHSHSITCLCLVSRTTQGKHMAGLFLIDCDRTDKLIQQLLDMLYLFGGELQHVFGSLCS